MAVEYDISSDVAVIKETGSVSQCARVTQMYSGQITYDDEAGSKFATATINGKSQRVMLCIAVSGTVTYDDVPSLYSTVDGHRCLNIVTPTETGTPDDVPSLYETVVIDGQNVRAVRCIMINKTPVYDGVSSTCTFTGDDGKTHTAQLVNKVTGGSVEVIIKGTSPLNLPDAIANSLSYVKAFGGTEQRNLPDGYTQLSYIESSGTQYIDTGKTYNSNYKYELTYQRTQDTSTPFAGYRVGPSATDGQNVSFTYTSEKDAIYYANTATSSINSGFYLRDTNKHTIILDASNSICSGDGVNYWRSVFLTTEIVSSQNFYLFTDNRPTLVTGMTGRFYSYKVTDGNQVIQNLVPCKRNSDNVLGMYDTVSGTFFTNAGTGDFAAGPAATPTPTPTPDAPVDIVSNNGVIKYGQYGKNLFDIVTVEIEQGSISSSTGQNTGGTNRCRTVNYVPVQPSTEYTLTANIDGYTGSSSAGVFVYQYNSDASSWITSSWKNPVSGYTFTTDPTTVKIRIVFAKTSSGTIVPSDVSNVQLELGPTATPYEPYHFGIHTDGTVETIKDSLNNTATAEMLLKVGNYQDEQEILSGVVTRKVGIKVFDGTEGWVKGTSFYADISLGALQAAHSCICNYYAGKSTNPYSADSNTIQVGYNDGSLIFWNRVYITANRAEYATAADFKAYLADQYAAGTPVIVVYPLATPTTESVAGQPLQVQAGDNTLEITQASLNGLELEAQYNAAVSLTIQEVEDANLDNNVTVTIQ